MKKIILLILIPFILVSCGKEEDSGIGDTNNIKTETGSKDGVEVIKDGEGTSAVGVKRDRFGNSINVETFGKQELSFLEIENFDNYDIITLFGGEGFTNSKIKIEIRGLRNLDVTQFYPGNDCMEKVRDGLILDELKGKNVELKNYQNGTADVYIAGQNLLDILKDKGAINRGDSQVSGYYSICNI